MSSPSPSTMNFPQWNIKYDSMIEKAANGKNSTIVASEKSHMGVTSESVLLISPEFGFNILLTTSPRCKYLCMSWMKQRMLYIRVNCRKGLSTKKDNEYVTCFRELLERMLACLSRYHFSTAV